MPKPFTFKYDATGGILIASALREKAEAETTEAEELETLAFGGGPETDFHELKALQARNRARVLQEAADDIRKTVHNALVEDFDKAFKRQGL